MSLDSLDLRTRIIHYNQVSWVYKQKYKAFQDFQIVFIGIYCETVLRSIFTKLLETKQFLKLCKTVTWPTWRTFVHQKTEIRTSDTVLLYSSVYLESLPLHFGDVFVFQLKKQYRKR